MADPKTEHWKDVVLDDTGVTPGIYGPAQIDVGVDGRIVNASSLPATAPVVVATIAGLPGAASSGDQAIVLDDGSSNEQMYVWNSANADLGPPLRRWRLLATTLSSITRVDYRQQAIATLVSTTISTPITATSIIKEVSVEITTAYSGGASITIQNDAGFIYMSSAQINPQLIGTYSIGLQGNLTDDFTNGGAGDLEAIIGGAPGVGAAVVFVNYVDS